MPLCKSKTCFICLWSVQRGKPAAASVAVWEMFYCESAYDGLMEAQICVGVCDGSLRPHFNESCPLPYQKLAMKCWAQNPEDR